MAIFGKYTAFPHGSIQPQQLREGDMVLVDDGCTVEGYQSDITRTTVFGKPTARQTQVWNLERKAQDAALAAAKAGRDLRIGGRGGAQSDHRRGLRPRLQGAGIAASHRARHRPRRPRVDVPGEGQQDAAAAGHVLQRRADDRDLRRVRHSPGRLHVHHREMARACSRNRARRSISRSDRFLCHRPHRKLTRSGSRSCRRR